MWPLKNAQMFLTHDTSQVPVVLGTSTNVVAGCC